MQVLFNELSLAGQFADVDAFVKKGLLSFVGVLKEMQGFSTLLLKKSDVWNCMVTPRNTLHSILVGESLRSFDEVRRLKSAIADLTKEPFWDSDSKQRPDDVYTFEGSEVGGTSVAEAYERDRALVSFLLSRMSSNPLEVQKNSERTCLHNFTVPGVLTELLWSGRGISFEAYLRSRFGRGKLDFSRVDPSMGFELVQPSEQGLFVDTFRKFEELTWDQIYINKGLDYKEYHGSVGRNYRALKTHKFRASEKIRCHGFRQGDRFVVIGFETDHKLSDQG